MNDQIIAQKTGELGFADFGDALTAYVAVHDSAVEATNRDPHSKNTMRLTESERAARESILRYCIKIGRELNEKARSNGWQAERAEVKE